MDIADVVVALAIAGCGSKVDGNELTQGTEALATDAGSSEGGASPTGGGSSMAATPSPESSEADTTAATSDAAGSSSEDGTSSGSTADEPEAYTVSGTITRSVEPASTGDGVGDLYLAVVDVCGFAFDVTAFSTVMDADPGVGAPFAITGVPAGTWHVVAFLDDNGNANPVAPEPDRGDLVVSADGGLGCAEFTIDGADATDVDLDLNFVLQF